MSKRTPLTFTPEKKGSLAPAAVQETATPSTTVRGKGRQGRQFIAAHVVPEAAKQFKLLAVQQDRTTQDLLVEAINDLFANNWLRVLDTTERSQVDQGICHQLHPIVPLLNALKPQEEPLELVFPRKGPLDPHP